MGVRCTSCAYSGKGHYSHCIEGYREDIGQLLAALEKMEFDTRVIEDDRDYCAVPVKRFKQVVKLAGKLGKRMK
jgi:hypothetical protein